MLVAGRYELGDVVGTGGMARVHRAHDVLLDRTVAVKLFRDDLDEEAQARATQEMKTLARLSHPGLVAMYDAGTWEGRPFLVMELVEGPTLTAAADARAVGAQVAAALAYVHSQGVVHRDVKPANILLSPEGAKLTDFGIARVVDGARHTGTGLTVGTAPFLAPEQVTGDPVTPATDVYALGLVLLEVLTGVREYVGSPVEVALARLHRTPQVPSDLPDPWPSLLTAMTSRIPSQRPSAAEVASVLAGQATLTLALPLPQQPRVPKVLPAPEPAARRAVEAAGVSGPQPLIRMAAAAAGVLVVGTAIAALSSSSSASTPVVEPPATPAVTSSPAAPALQPAAVVKTSPKPAAVTPRKKHRSHEHHEHHDGGKGGDEG